MSYSTIVVTCCNYTGFMWGKGKM